MFRKWKSQYLNPNLEFWASILHTGGAPVYEIKHIYIYIYSAYTYLCIELYTSMDRILQAKKMFLADCR